MIEAREMKPSCGLSAHKFADIQNIISTCVSCINKFTESHHKANANLISSAKLELCSSLVASSILEILADISEYTRKRFNSSLIRVS